MEGFGRTGVGSEPSHNGDIAPVGIGLVVVAKKLHMPAVGDSFVRARGAAARASETPGRLLKLSVGRMRTVVNAVVVARGGLEEGMESFWDRDDPGAHAAFLKWREENADGFVINCKTANEMWLHRSRCSAFDFRPGTKVSLTRNRKVCSLDRDQLVGWATKTSGRTPRLCSRCAP